MAPSQTIIVSFALMISVGAALLNLPIASKTGRSVGLLNAVFTSASASCVIGLTVVNTAEYWTWFGKGMILLLTQIGALGFMSVMIAAMLFTRHPITLRNRQAIQASFNQDDIGGMAKFAKNVVLITLIFESAGAALLAVSFYFGAPAAVGQSVCQGIFHSISAFCNAGFDNFGSDSLARFQNNTPVNLVMMALITAGGLGFPVWAEMGRFIKNPQKRSVRNRIIHLDLHTKMVFVITAALTLSGFVLFLLFEWSNPATLGLLTPFQRMQAALFQSVTLRTAGFHTIPQEGLTEESKFISCILMLIGGSPASTAGGIKTIAVGILIFSMLSLLKGRNDLEAFKRSLPLDLLQKALTVTSLMLIVTVASTLFLCFSERANPYPHTFLDLLFEACSAAGTVGLGMGITPYLSAAGKIVLIICMYLGRLGPVTVVVALNAKLHAGSDRIGYPNERVIIG